MGSLKRKRLKELKLSDKPMDIDEMIHLASRKLCPIIEMLADNSINSEHYLTKKEFDNAITAANIIKDIYNVLVYADFKISTKNVDFALENYKVTLNDQGKIYVETGLLLQLIELYNVLEDTKDIVDEFYRSIGIHSFVQTESSLSICSKESLNPNRIVLRLTKPITESSTSFEILQKNFLVMPATTDDKDKNKSKASLKRSKSAISTSSKKDLKDSLVNKVKSTGSLAHEEMVEVTDVYGAKRVVVKCIYDLHEVSKYLGTERKDASTICSRVEVDDSPSSKEKSFFSIKSNRSNTSKGGKSERKNAKTEKAKSKSQIIEPLEQTEGVAGNSDSPRQTEGGNECCCPECYADSGSGADLQEGDDDKVIICIKGCNEDEGDVQIVIRQCPDCKKAAAPSFKRSDKSLSIPEQTPPQHLNKPDKAESLVKSKSKSEHKIDENKEIPDVSLTKNKEAQEVESVSLHKKDSQESYVGSDEEEEDNKQREGSVSSTETPSHPLDEIDSTFFEPSTSESQKTTGSKHSSLHQESHVECAKIRLFETTKICLETDTGQDLVISLTVTPKGTFSNKKLSIRDIFSEEYADPDHLSDKVSIGSSGSQSRHKPPRSVEFEGSAKPESSSKVSSHYVAGRVIPLHRTKICSSIDFDVTTLETRIRDKGMEHKNAKIVVQLQELGINNLLRASRPAKCCRKAVLNEKMKKCLPYPPSLRSLPLDEADMTVINQSLQMSLQKVKNSTNLNKDFYANYSCSIKPIQTIMYFFVEEPKNKLVREQVAVRQKLSYYINLVNDIEFGQEWKFDIMYFGVEDTSKKFSEEAKKGTDEVNQNVPNKHLVNEKKPEVITDHSKWGLEKFNKYEDRPMLTGYTNISQNESFPVNNDLSLMKNHSKAVNGQTERRVQSESKKKIFVSRIPIYKGIGRSKYINREHNYIDQMEQEVYDISLDSLPREAGLIKGDNLSSGLGSKSSSTSKNKPSDKEISDHKNVTPYIEHVGCLPKSSSTSRYSVLSNYVPRKIKRKKKSFYLSRSKSDISLKTVKLKCKHRATNTQSKCLPKETSNKKCNTKNNTKEISSISNNIVNNQDSSNIVLNYFSKMLYNMIIRESLKEKMVENMVRNANKQENCTETAENKSLYEIYKRFSNKNTQRVNLEIKHLDVESNSTHHNLKAKKSQSCIVIASKTCKKNVCIINNLAMQTSVLFGDTKQCQTSRSLSAYLMKPESKPGDATYIQKKRIFKKIYNSEALSGIPNSCDQLEKFVVVFRSEHSLKSIGSDNTNFLSSASDRSDRSLDFSQHSLNDSLLRLKETLEKYETVKNEITHGTLKQVDVNPIEYFVYQMCACSKFNKKPSVMQKLLSKSRGLFSSVDKEMCTKYRNQTGFFSMPSTDRQQLCHQCGCFISKCEGSTPLDKKLSDSSILCQCSPDNKPKKLPPQPCCKTQKSSNFKTTNNFSKITSASMSSVRCLKSYLKKSLFNIKSRSRHKTLEPCSCDKQTTTIKNVKTRDGINVMGYPKKDTSTGTTKDSTTQKCECSKCENFAEDGTCCCSHCLGCLDKSFDVKPDNNNAGTLCLCLDNSPSKGDLNNKDTADSANTDKTSDIESPNNNTINTTGPPEDKNSSAANTSEKVSSNENPTPVSEHPSSDNQQNGEVLNVGNSVVASDSTNQDTTSYYFFTSPPNMFTQFSTGSRNPFEQYLLNFPHVNMLRLDNSQTFLNE